MTEQPDIHDRPTCRWVASDQPRVVPNRHELDCADDECRGCQPCEHAHCRVCGRNHADGTCPACLAEVRDDLAEIVRMCESLPEEVEHRGINGEAMVLLGPVADPEARGHRIASAGVGRAWVDEADHEQHPLTVLGTWSMVYAEEFDHDQAECITVINAADYLDRNLTYAGDWPHAEFADFARDLRKSRAHMERVLHDGEQVERTKVPCLDDGTLLEVRYAKKADDDRHVCPKCRRRYDDGEYALAKAEWLSSEGAERFVLVIDAASAIGRSEQTVRTWAKREVVQSQRNEATGRLEVWWPDVRDEHRDRRVRELRRKAG